MRPHGWLSRNERGRIEGSGVDALKGAVMDELVQRVWSALGAINDPCSVAMGCPMSLTEMGLVRRVDSRSEHIAVVLELTEPTCMLAFHIAEEVKDALQDAVGGRSNVEVELSFNPDDPWTEARIGGDALARLREHRSHRRTFVGTVGAADVRRRDGMVPTRQREACG